LTIDGPFGLDLSKSCNCPFAVRDLSVIVPAVKLRGIQVKILLAGVVEVASYAAVRQAESFSRGECAGKGIVCQVHNSVWKCESVLKAASGADFGWLPPSPLPSRQGGTGLALSYDLPAPPGRKDGVSR
jgi:hypothetical protein